MNPDILNHITRAAELLRMTPEQLAREDGFYIVRMGDGSCSVALWRPPYQQNGRDYGGYWLTIGYDCPLPDEGPGMTIHHVISKVEVPPTIDWRDMPEAPRKP